MERILRYEPTWTISCLQSVLDQPRATVTIVLRDIAYLLLALPSSHRHELSGKSDWVVEWRYKSSSEALCTASGEVRGKREQLMRQCSEVPGALFTEF
jgi:hypothetical protein